MADGIAAVEECLGACYSTTVHRWAVELSMFADLYPESELLILEAVNAALEQFRGQHKIADNAKPLCSGRGKWEAYREGDGPEPDLKKWRASRGDDGIEKLASRDEAGGRVILFSRTGA